MAARTRLDAELVGRGLAPSREQARRWIDARQVTVNGAIAEKPARLVAPSDAVEVLAPAPRYVGRGGEKLEGALTAFGIDPTGYRGVDVGSSTGGFTDCLLQHGAVEVVAIDVGRAQLHDRLRRDPRVAVHEQTDVRVVDHAVIGAPFDLVVVDVSFIGIERILDDLVALAGAAGTIVVLVKPQFEAGRVEADRGRGVIREPCIWRRVLIEAIEAARQRGLRVGGLCPSPIKGGAGNVEFFLELGGPGSSVGDLVEIADVDRVLVEAGELP